VIWVTGKSSDHFVTHRFVTILCVTALQEMLSFFPRRVVETLSPLTFSTIALGKMLSIFPLCVCARSMPQMLRNAAPENQLLRNSARETPKCCGKSASRAPPYKRFASPPPTPKHTHN
jgi:hypothetical protein